MANGPILSGFNIGALNNAPRALVKIPTGLGGITILGASVTQSAAGTQTLRLIDLGTSGTVVSGTLATLTSGVAVANVPQAFTLGSAPQISEGHYLGVEEGNVGTTATVTIIGLSYEVGK
jgi:hypothetical protein